MEILLKNSLSRKIEAFKPLENNTVRMYSCGPTVYNYAHIGNMRAFLFADLLQRVLKVVGGHEVRWVMNITNIDDKTIRDSAPGSTEWREEMGLQSADSLSNLIKFTKFFEDSFLEDINALGIRTEDFFAMPKATDFIESMQELIKTIINKGLAYISEGSIYFNVAEWRKVDTYGRLKNIDFDNFRSGVRIDADQYDREQVNDFALWKAYKTDEPYWDFEIDGVNHPGRPGWHIECSAMEKELLGLPFDIHTGGIDLQFPHHEDEIAQSKAGYGVDPTVFWCHNEFLEVEGEKMSKSKGNFFTLRDLLNKGIDPVDIRFAMLSAHYASTFNFTIDGVAAARKARNRVQDYIYGLFDNNLNGDRIINSDLLKEQVYAELGNDLHTPKALAKLFSFINDNPVNEIAEASKKGLINFFNDLNNIFDAWLIEEKVNLIPVEIIDLAEQRILAKKNKDFKMADELRSKISDAGYIIKDAKDSFSIEKI
jgi:cysteinyl-tRNA synthetase